MSKKHQQPKPMPVQEQIRLAQLERQRRLQIGLIAAQLWNDRSGIATGKEAVHRAMDVLSAVDEVFEPVTIDALTTRLRIIDRDRALVQERLSALTQALTVSPSVNLGENTLKAVEETK